MMTEIHSSAMKMCAPRRVPILMYHSLDESGSAISVSPDTFRAQMDALSERGYRGMCLRELIAMWRDNAVLPEKAVVITFDDAFFNFEEHALAVLRKHEFSATVFAVSDYLGKVNDWPSQPQSIPRLPLMSITSLRAMVAEGIEVGAHSATHPGLDDLGMERATAEIVRSRQVLEDVLGAPVISFAYPYGRIGVESERLVRRYFQAACTVDMRTASRVDDLYRLPRIDMYYFRQPGQLESWGTARFHAYLAARRLLRGTRRLAQRAAARLATFSTVERRT